MMVNSLLEFLEFSSDHIDAFGMWPIEFEDGAGNVWQLGACLDALKEYPSLEALFWGHCDRVWNEKA
jgi:hypothetical protein